MYPGSPRPSSIRASSSIQKSLSPSQASNPARSPVTDTLRVPGQFGRTVPKGLKLDVASFAATTYSAESYLRATMEADTEEAVHQAVKSLTVACDKSIAELRRAVYKNHVEFLEVTKEIVDFEGGLGEIRTIQAALRSAANALVSSAGVASLISLEESKAIPSDQQIEGSTVAVPKPLPTTPSAVDTPRSVDLDTRRAKMTALVDVIADFEKYLTPNRHLILEGGGLSEQAGHSTFKPITLYLFNDSVAMASKKARLVLSSAAKKLTLERLWLLNEVSVMDLPDTKNVSNALKISRGGEQVVLQAETATGKRLWLQHILKAQRTLAGDDDVSVADDNTSVGRPGTPRTPITGNPRQMRGSPLAPSPAGGGSPAAPTSTITSKHRRKISAMSKKEAQQPAEIPPEKHASLVALLDRLNAETDKCNYDAAVEAVDKIKYELAQMDPRAPALHPLGQRLQTQVAKLASFLYHEIADLIIGKAEMSKHIQRLVVLGFPDEARERFLAARSDFIRERTKHLRYTGDVAKTVNDIGFATFSSVASSADWYVSSFKDHTMTAGITRVGVDVHHYVGFVFWVKLEINNYVNMIVKQVFNGSDLDFRLIGDCVAIARRQCAGLRKIGLDFVYYLDDQLLPHVNVVLQRYQTQCETHLKESIQEDDFMEDKVEIARQSTNFPGITTSTAKFYQIILAMLNDVEPLLLDATAEVLAARLASFFENYSTGLLQASYQGSSATAILNIAGNVEFLANEFLPSLARQLETRFGGRTFADLAKLDARLTATVAAMYKIFAENQATGMVPQNISAYSEDGMLNDNSGLSPWLVTMLPLYAKISRDVTPSRKVALMRSLLTALISELEKRTSTLKFGSRGVQQYLLDIHFLLLASTPFLGTDNTQIGLAACQSALSAYKQAGGNEELHIGQWYDDMAQALLQRYPLDFGPIHEQ